MAVTSGPITVEIKEGMVTEARHVYEDTRTAFTDDWPKWVQETLERIELEAAERFQERTPE